MSKKDIFNINKCKIATNGVFQEFLKPFKYLNGDCIKKNCINPRIYNELQKVAKYYKVKYNNTNDSLVKQLATHLKCTHHTVSCLLNKIVEKELGDSIVDNALLFKQMKDIKPPGPFNSKEWFSNVNIDSILEQFEELFKDKHFLHIYFHMRDFKDFNSEPEEKKNLNKIVFSEYYKKGIRCFGVVFNTDVSSGNGEHWFALFGDFSKQPFTIEHFNSSGDTPLPEICDLMCKIKHEMLKYLFDKNIDISNEYELDKKNNNDKFIDKGINTGGNIDSYNNEHTNNCETDLNNELKCGSETPSNKIKCINVTKIVNQKDNHSCGSYSLFYILCRLCGISYKVFEENEIGDKLMHDFRNHLFAHNY